MPSPTVMFSGPHAVVGGERGLEVVEFGVAVAPDAGSGLGHGGDGARRGAEDALVGADAGDEGAAQGALLGLRADEGDGGGEAGGEGGQAHGRAPGCEMAAHGKLLILIGFIIAQNPRRASWPRGILDRFAAVVQDPLPPASRRR